tara:strand:+ start:127 stop:777 length:651 start_codon:yes stop_codon:yes gene_type:complete
MRIESKLCHISENKAIVQVNGWIKEKNVGSALAEGPTVELAEDKAILRLKKRVNITNKDSGFKSINEESIKNPINSELSKTENVEDIKINKEPRDWSIELSAIDLEIERLKWSREDEINFLIKNFGYNNRNKITKYDDILNYLSLLKNTDKEIPKNTIKGDISNLIKESDIILKDLSWDYNQGREYLQKEFNVSTRRELNEKQLISFISKLKSIRN